MVTDDVPDDRDGGVVMSARDDAAEALYSAIALQARAFENEAASESKAAAIRQLAEALAWLNSPDQPH
jgi:hypothetical protein